MNLCKNGYKHTLWKLIFSFVNMIWLKLINIYMIIETVIGGETGVWSIVDYSAIVLSSVIFQWLNDWLFANERERETEDKMHQALGHYLISRAHVHSTRHEISPLIIFNPQYGQNLHPDSRWMLIFFFSKLRKSDLLGHVELMELYPTECLNYLVITYML